MVEKLTLSEIIRHNTNITHVARHVFYSTLHCSDVKDEQCTPYLNSSTSEPTHELPTDVASEVHNLTQTVEQLRNKSHALENKFTLNENEKQSLKTQLMYLQQKYDERCNSTLEKNITLLKQENQMLRNKTKTLQDKQGTESKADKSVVDERTLVLMIVLLCVLLISTVTFCVLYLRAKQEYKKLLLCSQFDHVEQNPTKSTSL